MTKKLTTQEYVQKLKKVRGDEITLLSEYQGSNKPVKVRFNDCGHVVIINKPYNLLNGSKCKICRDNRKRMTTDEFKRRIKNIRGNDYQLVGQYKNSRTKVTIRHSVCNREYHTLPKNVLAGYSCPYCSSNAMWTTDRFKQELFNKYGNVYTVLGKYTGSDNPIEVKHDKCGNVWYPTPSNLLSGHSHCPRCSAQKLSENSRLSYSDVQQRVSDIFNGSILLTNPKEYHNMETMLHYKCLICGYQGKAMAKNMLQGHGCPKCADYHRNDGIRLTESDLRTKTKEITNGTYEFVGGTYYNNTSVVKFKHLECGTVFFTTWGRFRLNAVKCPHCRGSRGEQLVKGYLDQYHISYKYGYLIPDLKDKKKLHFDFWLSQFRIAIEYDGIQHYKEISFKSTEGSENFSIIKAHDRMKNNYCYHNNITLIRIPYYANVNDFLDCNLLPLLSIKRNNYDLEFKRVSSKDLRELMTQEHYLHRQVAVKYGYGLFINNLLMGMVTYSVPNSTTISKVFGDEANLSNSLELSRLYIKDIVSLNIDNITSRFVAWTLKQLKQEQGGDWHIISFADSGMHHTGAIYQATNFMYCGESVPTGEFAWGGENRYRERWQPGVYYRYLIQPTVKYRYVTFVGSKTFKKYAKKGLRLSVQPYPKHDTCRYQIGETESRVIKDRETGKLWKESDLVAYLNNCKH